MNKVQQFRKKPVVIEAIQLTWANWDAICEFVPKPWFVKGVWLDKEGNPLPEDSYRFGENNDDIGLIMRTLESQEFLAKGNDWIIKGVNGEFYPCKPDIFAATYEMVEKIGPGDPIDLQIAADSPDYFSLRQQLNDFVSTFYGPYSCGGCGSPIVRRARERGGQAYHWVEKDKRWVEHTDPVPASVNA